MSRRKRKGTVLTFKSFGLALGSFLGLVMALSAVFYMLSFFFLL
ncbi:MAG: hypothetical protein SCK29_03210 [Bacillota bacterium]|nr:hypothetical protein [Bacillota bacterium]MDW7683113.1 hypothetical protein [Bacillota bacterium]